MVYQLPNGNNWQFAVLLLLAFLALVCFGCASAEPLVCPSPGVVEVQRPVPVVAPPPSVALPVLPELPIALLDSTASPSLVARSWEISVLMLVEYVRSYRELLCSVATCNP